MSFSFNGPSFRPMIQESQSMKNNGGGGNLGYFQRDGKRKDEDSKQSENADCFIKEDEQENKEENTLTFWEKLRKLFFGN